MVSSGGDCQVQLLEVGPRPLDLRPAGWKEGAGAWLHFGFFPGHGDWLTGTLGYTVQVSLAVRHRITGGSGI